MPKVVIEKCADYAPERVRAALENALEPLGGLDWVRPGMRICVKANLVSGLKPEQAATTHPALLCALTEMLKERGANVVVGDSPGGLYNAMYVGRIYNIAGMKQVEAAGAALNRDFGESEGVIPEAKIAKRITYTSWLDGADAIIDFCKLKSHGMMSMSAAVKNLFGTIPGTMKPEYHFKYPNETDFAEMLVDLNLFFKPRLAIVDAVVGMEGNGPTAGTPRQIGCVVASDSTFHADLVCARIMGLGMKDVPTIRAAHERGLCPASADEVDVAGDLAGVCVPDYQNILSHRSIRFQGDGRGTQKLIGQAMEKFLTSRPQVKPDECVGCGVCAKTCPAKAIDMATKKPVIDRSKCIRCFCCQEFCPKGAMKVHRPFIARLLNKAPGNGGK